MGGRRGVVEDALHESLAQPGPPDHAEAMLPGGERGGERRAPGGASCEPGGVSACSVCSRRERRARARSGEGGPRAECL